MNVREWNSLDNIQAINNNQIGDYDDIFLFFTSFYQMMVFEKSFVFDLPNSLGDLEIDGLDDYCKKLFQEFLSPYASACVDEVISWSLDRELMLLLCSNELSEKEKSRVHMFSVLLKKTLRKDFLSLRSSLYSIESLVGQFSSGSVKKACAEKFRTIERVLE